MSFLNFLRHYAPVSRNENMYDETIQRAARRSGMVPFDFEHPAEALILGCFQGEPVSVVLTGTAGDGKTHLCRKVWGRLGGEARAWESDDPYLSLMVGGRTVHVVRDLSAFAPQQGLAWKPEREALLLRFSESIFLPDTKEAFIIAVNDGQLMEAWERLTKTQAAVRARDLFEELLVEDRQGSTGLRFFNLSRWCSAEVFRLALATFLGHGGWLTLQAAPVTGGLWSDGCPVRRNYELLQTPLVQDRLLGLLELCDQNGFHIPIRQMFMLLANAVLGHPDARDGVMAPDDVARVLAAGSRAKASLYGNVFGSNLQESRRLGLSVFDYLDRFQIGHETSNRLDNLLIFGEHDERLKADYQALVANDTFYGADAAYVAAKQTYIDGAEEPDEADQEFFAMLVAQRQGLFFRIPAMREEELKLWDLTVFNFAGEYLKEILTPLRAGRPVKRHLLARLVKGLNRVFTGMLVNSDADLHIVTSGNNTQAKISRVYLGSVAVTPSKGERVHLRLDKASGRVRLTVQLAPDSHEEMPLTLTRYEFLSRIAQNGALPASFSKECYEDILAFKGRLLAAYARRQQGENTGDSADGVILLKFLAVTADGKLGEPSIVEVTP